MAEESVQMVQGGIRRRAQTTARAARTAEQIAKRVTEAMVGCPSIEREYRWETARRTTFYRLATMGAH